LHQDPIFWQQVAEAGMGKLKDDPRELEASCLASAADPVAALVASPVASEGLHLVVEEACLAAVRALVALKTSCQVGRAWVVCLVVTALVAYQAAT